MRIDVGIHADAGHVFDLFGVQMTLRICEILKIDRDKNIGEPRAVFFHRFKNKGGNGRRSLVKSKAVRGIEKLRAPFAAFPRGKARKDAADRRMTVDYLEILAVDDAPEPAVCFYIARGKGSAVEWDGMENVAERNFRTASAIRRRDMRFVAVLPEPFEIWQMKRLDVRFYDRGDKQNLS